MFSLADLYRDSLSLLTDLYQLTMAYGYWKSGTSNKETVFNLFFRKRPFQNGYALACGLSCVLDYIENLRFTDSDIEYLTTLTGADNQPLFENAFLEYLRSMKFDCDVDAIPEGSVVFAHEPLLRVSGPIVQCQILETALLNIYNFQTLIATKAARIRQAAGHRPVIEFGLRRAQGVDGAVSASWAAYIGGCDATSNVLAGKLHGIPVRGTHAHSWIMSFDNELEAFKQYAKAMPNNCLFLVDTYDTLDGVRHAIEVGRWLRENGHEMIGIRLDSGDLHYLSVEARKLLDEAGFEDATIFATNDLDENIIESLNLQGAQINAWGVGTKLVTAYDQPALGGVYKMTAVREPGEDWQYKVKVSEQSIKISNPGIQQVRRFYNEEGFIADMIYDVAHPPSEAIIVDPLDITRRKKVPAGTTYVDLLEPVMRGGKRLQPARSAHDIKLYAREQIAGLHSSIRRLMNPHQYPVGLELGFSELKTRLVLQARGHASREPQEFLSS